MSATYAVVCDEYTKGGFRTRESAEVALERIVALGACHAEHRVEEVER